MMLHEFLNRLWFLILFPLAEPPAFLEGPEGKIFLPEEDGRYFAWVRQRGAKIPASPVIVYDRNIGAKQEYVGNLHMLKPHEYGDDLDVLAARYPAPEVKED